MRFQREPLTIELLHEALPLFHAHHKEVGIFQDIQLQPDFGTYIAMEGAGRLRFFTARHAETGELCGYSTFIVMQSIHSKQLKHASQDLIFIKADRRGFGNQFIAWITEELRKEGCGVVYQTAKASHNFGKILERQGYQLVDLVYARRFE